MSGFGIQYPPPTEFLPIFDDSVFENATSATAGGGGGGGPFLEFPIAQGTEIFQDIDVEGTITLDKTSTLNRITTITASSTYILDNQNGPGGDAIDTSITPNNITMRNGNGGHQLSSISTSSLYILNEDIGPVPIDITVSAGAITATNWSVDVDGDASFSGIIDVVGLATFQTCPQTPVIPTLADDLINLDYLQNFVPTSFLSVSNNFTGVCSFSQNIIGNIDSASTVAITDDNVSATNYLVFTGNNTGNLALKVDKTTNPLSYNPASGVLTTQTLNYKEILQQSQTPASGSTLNFTLGSLIIDTSAVAITYTLPIYTASNNGSKITIQKTGSTNHTITITAGIGNQIASITTNVLGATYVLGLTTYQQSFRFYNNWYPF